jgi:thiol-disulfide isomerase/thioredoxin
MSVTKKRNMRYVVLALIVVLASANLHAQTADFNEITVALEKKTFPSTGLLTGISNIFFQKSDDQNLRLSKNWKEVELAKMFENPKFLAVNALRFKDAKGKTQYVVDTNGDLDFRKEKILNFQTFGEMEIADVVIQLRPAKSNGTKPRNTDYQIVLSKNGYIYARVSEYRQGNFRVGQNTYKIFLRPRTRGTPFFELSGNTLCLLDFNQDGDFAERWQVTENGEVVATEEINLSNPFILKGEKLKVVGMDEPGKQLTIARSTEEFSISEGFKAPDFSLKGLGNDSFNLQNLKGKIVLLEFWSINCPFCQRILPEVNTLIEKNKQEDFVSVAVARESDIAEINKYLTKNAYQAEIALNDGKIWQIYNSQFITPTYYLLDKEGVVRFSGYGANSDIIKVIDKKIKEIRLEKRD